MPYATTQDMIDRFGLQELVDLTDREGTGQVDQAVLDRALEDAGSDIDGYLMGRYKLPLTRVPRVLSRLCADLARYYLYEDRVTEIVADRHKHAVRVLEQVAAGKVHLDLDATDTAAAPGDGPTVSAPDRVFTTQTLKDFDA